MFFYLCVLKYMILKDFLNVLNILICSNEDIFNVSVTNYRSQEVLK